MFLNKDGNILKTNIPGGGAEAGAGGEACEDGGQEKIHSSEEHLLPGKTQNQIFD